MTCNYSTPYPIPESSGYYLYDGIDLTINTYYDRTAAVTWDSVRITRPSPHATTTFFNGFFAFGTPSCQSVWLNRCTHTFVQDSSCDPCEFSVTVSAFDSSTDFTEFVSNVAANTGTVFCIVSVRGKNHVLFMSSLNLLQLLSFLVVSSIKVLDLTMFL